MFKKRFWISILTAVMIMLYAFPAFADGAWVHDQFGWWYRNEDGSYPVSEWKQMDGIWYYFKNSGYMATGPVLVDEKQYYLLDSGEMVESSWMEIRGNWYYFAADGSMAQSCWIDDVYYVGKDGIMVKDKWIDGIYIDDEGVGDHPDDHFFE